MPDHPIHVVFFDHDCLLCNGTVKFLMARDKRDVLRFAPLQGPTAAALFSRCPAAAQDPGALGSIVLALRHNSPGEQVFLRSSAVAGALRELAPPWPLAGILLAAVPLFLRDWGYGIVARNRFRWFGRATPESCPVPTPDEARRLLP